MTLFVQLYESNTEAVKSEIATFLEAFPNGVVWGNTQRGPGLRPRAARPGRADARSTSTRSSSELQRPGVRAGRAVAARDRHELGGRSVLDLRRHAQPSSQPWLQDASINRDRNLRLQYLAGLGLNLYQSESIYADMLAYASGYPNDLFVGLGRDDQRAARRDPQGAGAVRGSGLESRNRFRVQGSGFKVRFRVRWVGSGFCFGMVSISEAAARHAVKVSHDRLVGDTAVEQVDVPSGLRDVARIVRREADRRAVGVQLGEHLHQRIAALRIQVAGRLVGEQDRRPAGDGAGDGDELLVAAG